MAAPPIDQQPDDILLDRLIAIADREVSRCLQALPLEIRRIAATLPVAFQSFPDPELAEELGPDLLGLFVGGALDEETGNDSAPVPAQIILFLTALWEYCDGNKRMFRHEVRQTYLHELGHYLGLDEDELTLRGLD